MLKTITNIAARKISILNLEGGGIVARTMVRTAESASAIASKTAYKGTISRDSSGEVDLVAEMSKHPDALWIRVKAIEADIPNDNGDNFPREELLKSYKTFEGVPVFTNHENSKAENAKGKVVKAEWEEKDASVYCTMFIDRDACAPLCRAIEEGYITDVSMGTQVDYSTCSICEKKAQDADSYCSHVKTMKGRTINGKKVFENNYGLKFIELSVVTDGACKSCTVREILEPEEFLAKVAETSKAVKDAVSRNAIEVLAGQGELQKLNQCMDLVQEVVETMLGQREFIDLEFAKKLMEVLADLQHNVDELVDQGYGRQGNPAEGAGVPPPPTMPVPASGEGNAPEVQNMPLAAAAPTGVGTVTEPALAVRGEGIKILSERLKGLQEKVAKLSVEGKVLSQQTQENDERSPNAMEKNEKAGLTVAKLARIWDPSARNYEGEIKEGDFKVAFTPTEIVGIKVSTGARLGSISKSELDEDSKTLLKEDPRKFAGMMLDGLREKFAAYAPTDTPAQQQMTEEAQLATQKPPLHPRQNAERQSITEDQLNTKEGQHARQEKDRDSITEAQLAKGGPKGYEFHKRQSADRQSITELQLRDGGIKGNSNPATDGKADQAAGVSDQQEQITQAQLEDWRKQDKGHNPDSITEKQLAKDSENWGRRIATKEDAKKALGSGLRAIAKTAAATGAAPEEFVSIIDDITSNSGNRIAAEKAVASLAAEANARTAMLKRAKFNGPPKGITVAEISDYLLGSVADAGLAGDVGVMVLEQIGTQKDACSKIGEAITAGAATEEEDDLAPWERLSSREMLKQVLAETGDKEEVRVILAASAVGNDTNAEKFAEKAFALAEKQAQASGLTITDRIHVAKAKDGKVEVSMLGSKSAKKADDDKKGKKCADDDGKKCADDDKKGKKADCSANALQERKEARRKIVAQVGGGLPGAPGGMGTPDMGGGAAPTGPMGTTMPAPGGAPGAAPAVPDLPPAPAGGEEEGKPTGESNPPGTTCPACGSDDVDLKQGDLYCNECGTNGTIEIVMRVKEWAGTLEDTEPKEKEAEPGIGEMAGGPGMEMAPPVGIAASFKVTPEMVKIAGNKPVGSWCPHCGSGKVKLELKGGSGKGECENCKGSYGVLAEVGSDKTLKATIAWDDRNAIKHFAAKAEARKQAEALAKANLEKKAALDAALRKSGTLAKFAKADLKGKAEIVAELADKGLLGKK